MTVNVLLFGHYREIIPSGKVSLDLADGATITDAANALTTLDTRLIDLLKRTRYAVNTDFAPADTHLKAGDEIAFLPPMSGG